MLHKCIQPPQLTKAKFDRNRLLSRIIAGLFSNYPLMTTQNTISQIPECREEAGGSGKLSFLKNIRHLKTGVCLSILMAVTGCSKAEANDSKNETQTNQAPIVKVAANMETANAPTTLEKGGGIDISSNSRSIDEIQAEMTLVNSQIQELESNDAPSRADRIALIKLKNQRNKLENKKQEINEGTIENYDNALDNFVEIRGKIGS